MWVLCSSPEGPVSGSARLPGPVPRRASAGQEPGNLERNGVREGQPCSVPGKAFEGFWATSLSSWEFGVRHTVSRCVTCQSAVEKRVRVTWNSELRTQGLGTASGPTATWPSLTTMMKHKPFFPKTEVDILVKQFFGKTHNR